MVNIPWLPERATKLVGSTVERLEQALGSRLVAAVLVGDAMNPSRPDRARAPEILAIVDPPLDLARLAKELAPPMQEGVRVRVMLQNELARSTDVFALEIAEWKARHLLLAGRNPFERLSIARSSLRASIETELRGLTRRIRNRVLTGLATDRRRDDPVDGVRAGYETLLVSAYHALLLRADEVPKSEEGIVRAIGDVSRADPTAFLAHLSVLRRGGSFDPLEALEALLAFAEPITDFVDALEVSA